MIKIKLISAQETYPLRHSVLRPNQVHPEVPFEGDNAAETFHLGAYDNEKLIGIVSLYRRHFSLFPRCSAWQLRGMATDPAYQGKGCGRMLVQAAIAQMQQREGELVWCNAREAAVPFYTKLAFKLEGERFEIPEVGPHYLMWREL